MYESSLAERGGGTGGGLQEGDKLSHLLEQMLTRPIISTLPTRSSQRQALSQLHTKTPGKWTNQHIHHLWMSFKFSFLEDGSLGAVGMWSVGHKYDARMTCVPSHTHLDLAQDENKSGKKKT